MVTMVTVMSVLVIVVRVGFLVVLVMMAAYEPEEWEVSQMAPGWERRLWQESWLQYRSWLLRHACPMQLCGYVFEHESVELQPHVDEMESDWHNEVDEPPHSLASQLVRTVEHVSCHQ